MCCRIITHMEPPPGWIGRRRDLGDVLSRRLKVGDPPVPPYWFLVNTNPLYTEIKTNIQTYVTQNCTFIYRIKFQVNFPACNTLAKLFSDKIQKPYFRLPGALGTLVRGWLWFWFWSSAFTFSGLTCIP